jgi:hypothetical protein
MNEPELIEKKDEASSPIEGEGEPHPADILATLLRSESGGSDRRATVSPPPFTEVARPAAPSSFVDPARSEAVQMAARALAAAPVTEPESEASMLLRALNGIRSALPFVQKLLPLLDGNVVTALSNVLAPRPHTPPPPKPVDTAPLESGLAELKTQQQELRGHILEQNATIRRLTEQLELVRDATERSTLEQQELIDELKASGKRLNVVAFLAFALLAASIALNAFLYFQIHRLLP